MTSETRRRATKRHAATANDRTTSDCSSEPKSRVWPRNQPQLAPPSATTTPSAACPPWTESLRRPPCTPGDRAPMPCPVRDSTGRASLSNGVHGGLSGKSSRAGALPPFAEVERGLGPAREVEAEALVEEPPRDDPAALQDQFALGP